MLDAILGNQEGYFSLGELIFFSQKGVIENEYCSCGNKVRYCPLWSTVIQEWEQTCYLSIDEYNLIHNQLFSSYKYLGRTIKSFRNPSREVYKYMIDTRRLYHLVFLHTKSDNIIDSSKNPLRLILFRSLGFDVQVIHLVRQYSGYLNSQKKDFAKDRERGIEIEIKPKSNLIALRRYLTTNILILILSKGFKRSVTYYEMIIQEPKKAISELVPVLSPFSKTVVNRGPFYSPHLIAGNKMRMDNSFLINPELSQNELPHLTAIERVYSKIISLIFSLFL